MDFQRRVYLFWRPLKNVSYFTATGSARTKGFAVETVFGIMQTMGKHVPIANILNYWLGKYIPDNSWRMVAGSNIPRRVNDKETISSRTQITDRKILIFLRIVNSTQWYLSSDTPLAVSQLKNLFGST